MTSRGRGADVIRHERIRRARDARLPNQAAQHLARSRAARRRPRLRAAGGVAARGAQRDGRLEVPARPREHRRGQGQARRQQGRLPRGARQAPRARAAALHRLLPGLHLVRPPPPPAARARRPRPHLSLCAVAARCADRNARVSACHPRSLGFPLPPECEGGRELAWLEKQGGAARRKGDAASLQTSV